MQLSPVNDFASVAIGVPTSGACDKKDWPVPIIQRAKIECGKEVVKTATPLTTDSIRTLPDGTFQVPVFTEVSWRVRIQVINVNLSGITDVVVADRFGAEYAVVKEAVSQGTSHHHHHGRGEEGPPRLGDRKPGPGRRGLAGPDRDHQA